MQGVWWDGRLTDAAVGQNYTLGVPSGAAGVHDTCVIVVCSLTRRTAHTNPWGETTIR